MLQWTVYHSVRSAEKNPNLSPNSVIALSSQTDFITQVGGKATPQTHSKSNIKSPSSQGLQAGWARLALKINEIVWPHHYQLQRECSGKQSRAERTKGHQGNWGFPLMFGSSWSWLQCKLCLIKSTVINKTQNQIQTEIDEDVLGFHIGFASLFRQVTSINLGCSLPELGLQRGHLGNLPPFLRATAVSRSLSLPLRAERSTGSSQDPSPSFPEQWMLMANQEIETTERHLGANMTVIGDVIYLAKLSTRQGRRTSLQCCRRHIWDEWAELKERQVLPQPHWHSAKRPGHRWGTFSSE